MKNLGVWQFVSLLSRFIALFLGLVQSVIITRILTVSEFGIVGIVSAIGALAGIAQHLGLASGTTREISAAKSENEIYKIFVSSVLIKYIITIPISLVLFVFAPYIAENIYKHPEITFSIKLYALILIIQGVQSIFNSIIAGLHHFKKLFIYQSAIALVSLFIYIPFVYFYRVDGYFIALTIFNVVGSLVLALMALYPLRNHLAAPSQREFSGIFKNILFLSIGIYFVKVLFTIWSKFGQLVLGHLETLEVVGIFSFALLYSSKLMAVSDALTDVNLPVFSKAFSTDFEEFKKLFRNNFDKVFILILFFTVSASFFAKDIINFAVGHKYDLSIPIIPFLVFSFAFYSYINLIKSSVLIPAKLMYEMCIGYSLMLIGTVVAYFALFKSFGSLYSMSFSMLFGAFLGFLALSLLIKRKLGFIILDSKIVYFSFYVFVLILLQFLTDNFILKSAVYSIYFLILAYLLKRFEIFNFFKVFERSKK